MRDRARGHELPFVLGPAIVAMPLGNHELQPHSLLGEGRHVLAHQGGSGLGVPAATHVVLGQLGHERVAQGLLSAGVAVLLFWVLGMRNPTPFVQQFSKLGVLSVLRVIEEVRRIVARPLHLVVDAQVLACLEYLVLHEELEAVQALAGMFHLCHQVRFERLQLLLESLKALGVGAL